MRTNDVLRIGFIGAGGNTKLRHLPGFRAIDGVELAAVANRSKHSGEEVAAEWGIPAVRDDWRSVAGDPGIDAVCIGTWPNLHREATCAALAAGKHVLCEARMARDLREALEMEEAARSRPDLVAQLVPSPFTLGIDEWIAARVPALGELLEIRVRSLGGGLRDPAAPLTWRLDPELSGRNTINLGILHEAILRWIDFREPEVVAAAGWAAAERPDPAGGTKATVIPESLQATARSAEGVRLLYDLSQLHAGPAENRIQLNGTKGRIEVDLAKGNALFEIDGKEPETRPIEDGWAVEADFVRSIREGAPVRRTSFADGVEYMRFTEAVWDAWNEC